MNVTPRLLCDDKERELQESVDYEWYRLQGQLDDYFGAVRELENYRREHPVPAPVSGAPF